MSTRVGIITKIKTPAERREFVCKYRSSDFPRVDQRDGAVADWTAKAVTTRSGRNGVRVVLCGSKLRLGAEAQVQRIVRKYGQST
jgi:hypothetical protein